MKNAALVAVALVATSALHAQDAPPVPPFTEYDPPSTLVVPEHPLSRSEFPFVDVHNHQWRMADQDLSELVAEMDKLNMAILVNAPREGMTELP